MDNYDTIEYLNDIFTHIFLMAFYIQYGILYILGISFQVTFFFINLTGYQYCSFFKGIQYISEYVQE